MPNLQEGPFQFDEQVLGEYPQLSDSDLTDREKEIVNCVVLENRLVQRSIPGIETGEPNIDVEYHIKMIGEVLDKVRGFPGDKVQKLASLVERESALLQENIEATRSVIRGRVRDVYDGRYKMPPTP